MAENISITNPNLSNISDNRERKNQNALTFDASKYEVTLEDIDGTIIEYMTKSLNLKVERGSEVIPVPVLFGSSERWNSIRKEGYLRDNNGKIQCPVIMIRRESFDEDETHQTFNRELTTEKVQQFSEKNKYDRFSLTRAMIPTKEIRIISFPDHVILTYSINIWTDYVTQMNKIQERILYANREYWHSKSGRNLRFKVNFTTFPNNIEVPTDDNRIVRCDTTFQVHAYLLPKVKETNASTLKQSYSKKIFIVNAEIEPTGTEMEIKPIYKTF